MVLIGKDTLNREFVQFEIQKSIERGNAIVGLKIHNISDMLTKTITTTGNVHTVIGVWEFTQKDIYFDEISDGIYDYVLQDGYQNLGNWIEGVAQKKGK